MFAQLQLINATRFMESDALESSVQFIFARVTKAIEAKNFSQAHAQLLRLSKELKEVNYYALEMSLVKFLLQQVMVLENEEQKVASNIVQFSLDCALDLMVKYGNDGLLYSFDFPRLTLALTRLPIEWKRNKSFLKKLLELFQREYYQLKEEKIIDNLYIMQPLIISFSHFMALPVHAFLDTEFKLEFIKQIQADSFTKRYKDDFYRMNFELLSALWKIYVALDWFKNEQQQPIFRMIENKLRRYHEGTEDILTESLLQKDVFTALTRILNRTGFLAMQEEYSIGPYRCDIAFPELKLLIEVNGPCHYRDTLLRRIDQFRNHLIYKRHGFEMVMISYQEIDALHKDEKRLEHYLKNKLERYSHLFKPERKIYQPPHVRQPHQFFESGGQGTHNISSMTQKPKTYVPPALRNSKINSESSCAETYSPTRYRW